MIITALLACHIITMVAHLFVKIYDMNHSKEGWVYDFNFLIIKVCVLVAVP